MSFIIALLALLGLIAAACGDDGESTTSDEQGASEEESNDDGSGDEMTDDETSGDGAASADEDMGPRTLNVPADHATIQEAVDAAEPGDLVLIDEGVYNEAVIVQTDEIVIRGVDRNTVILDGEHGEGMENGVIVFSDGVAIENLTVRNYTKNGLFWTGDYGNDVFVEGYRASYVTAHNNGQYGIYAFNAKNGQFDNSYASGSDDASYYIGQCDECNALIYRSVAEYSQLGYSGTDSSEVIIAESEFANNSIGVVPSSADIHEFPPNVGNIYVGNYIHDNNNTEVPSGNSAYHIGLGSGIVLGGTIGTIVERNLIVDNERIGVVIVDWLSAVLPGETDYPAQDNVIRDNVISGSTLDSDILLALDPSLGEGARGNCAEGNTIGGGTTPADIETVIPCGSEVAGEFPQVLELIDKFSNEFDPIDYNDAPVPDYTFEAMPDAATAPPAPAVDVPMELDLDAIDVPVPPE